jgi:hypothetical protein
MTKEEAEACRSRCVAAVKAAQAGCAKAIGRVEKDRAKAALAIRLEELAEAKAALRTINLLASGAKPSDAPEAPKRLLSTEEVATVLLESFQRLLIAEPGHAAIRTLRAHFEAERLKEAPRPAPNPRVPTELRSTGRPFLIRPGVPPAGRGQHEQDEYTHRRTLRSRSPISS